MADYSTIKGLNVETIAADPKLSQALGGAWSTGTNYPTSTAGMFGAGITTANVTYGGSPSLTAANKYDGSTWTSTGALTTGRDDMSGGGTQTAAFAVGGGYPVKDQMETYDGSTWSEDNDLNTARAKLGGAGTTTSAIVAGGEPSSHTDISEKWNGTSWSEVGNLNTSRHGLAGAGASGTSAIVFGGYVADDVANAESWNGTSWSAVSALNTARYYLGGAGIQTAAIAIGGSQNPPAIANTELWDGSTWAEGSDLGTAKFNMASGGTNINAMATGGSTPSATNGVEEWIAPSTVTVAQEGQVWYNSASNVLKGFGKQGTSAWAAGGTMNNARYSCQGFGTQTAALCGGGAPLPGSAQYTESYDGTTWTEVNGNVTSGKAYRNATGTSQSAGLYIGGEPSTTVVETWDGTCWTEGNDINTATYKAGGAGSTTAALKFGGTDPTISNTESYDGTCWSEVNDLVNNTRDLNSAGSQTAALCIGGYTGSTTADVEEWDGTSWAEGPNMNTAHESGSSGNGAQTSTAALLASGNPGYMTNVESWNGTAWTEVADVSVGRNQAGGAGSSITALMYAGFVPGGATNTTEEWSTPNAIKTFTAS